MAGGRVQINDPTITIPNLPPANQPLDGTEIMPVIQGGIAMRVNVNNLIGQAALASQGVITMQGGWNATTNAPILRSATGVRGQMYTVTVAGSTTLDGISQWNIGDKALFNGSNWEKIDGTPNEVVNVCGLTGAISGAALWTAMGVTPAEVEAGLGFTPVNKGGDTMLGQLNMGAQVLTNLPTPLNPLDAVNKAYADGLASGLHAVSSVSAASVGSNINTAAPGFTSLDGVSLTSGTSRILLKDQTANAQNGIYIFNGSGSPLTRSTDMNSWAAVVGALVPVSAGGTINGGTAWLNTNQLGGVLGTTGITFTQFSSATSGVSSFNSRNGAVVPASGDYSIGLLSAIAANSIVGNSTGASAAPAALSIATVQGMLNCALLSGASFTGNITITNTGPAIALNASASGDNALTVYQTNGVNRWITYKESTAESGSNAGSQYNIGSYTDAGVFLAVAMQIIRSSSNTTFAAQVAATSFNTTSDERMKMGIKPLTERQVRRVLGIEPKAFAWRKSADVRRHTGVIAQDVLRCMPEAVTISECPGMANNGMYTVDYQALTAALIGVVRQQDERIAALEAKLAA